eukprot:jgi/Mesen1/6343/ME000328S05620
MAQAHFATIKNQQRLVQQAVAPPHGRRQTSTSWELVGGEEAAQEAEVATEDVEVDGHKVVQRVACIAKRQNDRNRRRQAPEACRLPGASAMAPPGASLSVGGAEEPPADSSLTETGTTRRLSSMMSVWSHASRRSAASSCWDLRVATNGCHISGTSSSTAGSGPSRFDTSSPLAGTPAPDVPGGPSTTRVARSSCLMVTRPKERKVHKKELPLNLEGSHATRISAPSHFRVTKYPWLPEAVPGNGDVGNLDDPALVHDGVEHAAGDDRWQLPQKRGAGGSDLVVQHQLHATWFEPVPSGSLSTSAGGGMPCAEQTVVKRRTQRAAARECQVALRWRLAYLPDAVAEIGASQPQAAQPLPEVVLRQVAAVRNVHHVMLGGHGRQLSLQPVAPIQSSHLLVPAGGPTAHHRRCDTWQGLTQSTVISLLGPELAAAALSLQPICTMQAPVAEHAGHAGRSVEKEDLLPFFPVVGAAEDEVAVLLRHAQLQPEGLLVAEHVQDTVTIESTRAQTHARARPHVSPREDLRTTRARCKGTT